ncbi:hypothetical protein BASA81_017752 [Batrachochytrium salamandrivorans]|nr:hypothetical protein BASA81_017752 [Batrachochytrium salamandrivorans]
MELEKSSLAHRHSLDFMKSLVKKISKHALDKILDQYKKLADMDDSDEAIFVSKEEFNAIYQTKIVRSQRLSGRSVVMARLDEASQTPLQPLSNPELATKRGRPAGSTKRKAIQREKSLFEHATGRKCSKCGQAAHNSRTCNVQTSEQQ